MKIKLYNRQNLKSIFSNGQRPTEGSFSKLIDSSVNKVDDGISKDMKNGLILAPEGKESSRVLSFFEDIQNEQPDWTVEMNPQDKPGFAVNEPDGENEAQTRLFFKKGGNLGIETLTPRCTIEVNGIIGANARIGTHKLGTVPADGKWHNILSDLNGCSGFEIVAQVGKEKTGKYALVHANALTTFGRSRSRIRCTQAHYGFFWNKIALRWSGSTYDYSLQMKTRSNYGEGQEIKFYITRLWDNQIMSLFETPTNTKS